MNLVRPISPAGEIAVGYKGALMRFNAITSERRAKSFLLRWAAETGERPGDITWVQLLALAAGKDLQTYLRENTLYALFHAVAKKSANISHSQRGGAAALSRALGMRRRHAFLCDECVRACLGRNGRGRSVWWCVHQQPGRYWCPLHERLLKWTAAPNAFILPPSQFLANSRSLDAALARRAKDNAAVSRFLTLESALMSSEAPLDEYGLTRGLLEVAGQHGLHYGTPPITTKRGPFLSDFLEETFDRRWLDDVLPGFEKKEPGHSCSTVDNALMGRGMSVTPIAYVVIFAALYETVHKALSALTAFGGPRGIKPEDCWKTRLRRAPPDGASGQG